MKVLDLGTRPYQEVWDFQKDLVLKRIQNEISDTLILVEHPSVITKGRRTASSEILNPQFPIFEIERGGKATYHGPGQLVGYPIVQIEVKGGVKKYITLLEEVIITTLKNYNIISNRKEGATGVWVKDKKIASIGVAVKRWVTYHGFALNVNTDLSHFKAIQPCGFESSVMTSMQEILGRELSLLEVKQKLIDQVQCINIAYSGG